MKLAYHVAIYMRITRVFYNAAFDLLHCSTDLRVLTPDAIAREDPRRGDNLWRNTGTDSSPPGPV